MNLLLVVGSENSSNSKRLVEVGDNGGVRSYLVNDSGDIDSEWLQGVRNVGVTAGASAPEHLVQELIEFLQERDSANWRRSNWWTRTCDFRCRPN